MRLSDFESMRPMPPFIRELRDANRNGLKTQTRRVIDPQPLKPGVWLGKNDWEFELRSLNTMYCRYGKTGDLTYMREPLVRKGAYAFYFDDDEPVTSLLTGEVVRWRWKVNTLSQLFMPKEAARSFFRYEAIRIEKVQEISARDAIAEGLRGNGWYYCGASILSPYDAYQMLWDSINAKRGYGWDKNPWVWVLKYAPTALAGTYPDGHTSSILEEHQNGGGSEAK